MTCWTHTGCCPNVADTKMFMPDGTPVPGLYCRAHADAAIAEYAEKIKERWTMRAADALNENAATCSFPHRRKS